MEEINKNKLAVALKDLPEYEPDALVWNKIEASLDFEGKLKAVLPDLPTHEPADALWNNIEMQLEQPKELRHFNLKTYFGYFSAAAASVVILLCSIYFFRVQPKQDVKIAYSEEVVFSDKTVAPQNPDDTAGSRFIQEQCSHLPEICQKPEFRELKTQLEQLDAENAKIKKQIEQFGQDPVLIRNQIKIENLRAACTKELIQIIIS